MVVDAHAHVVVPGLGADVRWEDGAQVVDFGGRSIRSAVREFVDLERILEEHDRAGVDMVVLCPWVTLLGREPARQNEALAAMVGERVAALGTVDLERPEELVELMGDGRLAGVEVAASFDGDYLGAERFGDFWAPPRRRKPSSSSIRPPAASTSRSSTTSTFGTQSGTRSRRRSLLRTW